MAGMNRLFWKLGVILPDRPSTSDKSGLATAATHLKQTVEGRKRPGSPRGRPAWGGSMQRA